MCIRDRGNDAVFYISTMIVLIGALQYLSLIHILEGCHRYFAGAHSGQHQHLDVYKRQVLKEPVNEVMIVGGKQPLTQLPASAMTTDSYFIWPVDGGYLSCGFYG